MGINQRQQFAATMLHLMEHDEKIVVLLGDIGVYSFSEHMRRWPTKVLNMGVAEQGMVGFAAGLCMAGFYPIVSTIDSFLVRRAYEFIRLDFAEQRLPGLFVSVGHDHDYEKLGETHRCPESRSMLRNIPGLLVIEPHSDEEASVNIERACKQRAFAFIRLSESHA